MKKRMPTLKAPEMKLPPVLADLVHDLRDRRLLPFVALVLVAIVAVPILLSDSTPEVAETGPAGAIAAGVEMTAELTVVQTDHGLREPGKRLAHLTPKDPFAQHFTGPSGSGSQVTTETEASTSATVTSSTTTESETGTGSSTTERAPAGTSPSQSGSGGGAPPDGAVTVYTFAVDLRIVKVTPDPSGGKPKKDSETRHGVLPATTLPGKNAQVVTYLGISPQKKRPLFMVSDEVTGIFGEAECVAGAGNCQLVEAEPGFSMTLVYGPNHVRFKFTVLDIEPVATGHL
jgi:hypothetical protein